MLRLCAGVALSVLLVAGCQASQMSEKTVQQGRVERTIEVNDEGETVVCQKETATGSNLRVNKYCGTRADRDVYAEDFVRFINRLIR
jgi:hypothetical protein